MAVSLNNPRILSQPIRVVWAGWESNTVRLQQAGWSLSAAQSPMDHEMRIALRHEGMRCYAFSEQMRNFNYRGDYRDMPPLRIQNFACHVEVVRMMEQWTAFEPIDAAPQFVEQEIKSIKDLNWFATPLARTEQIIVEPQTVAEMLERIREMQAPEQAALREKQRKQLAREEYEAGPRQVFHAQIISLADRKAA